MAKPSLANKKVVAYVNRLRAQLGLEPIDRLPEPDWQNYDTESCPIALALDGKFYSEVAAGRIRVWKDERSVLSVKPPQYVENWIMAIDEFRESVA